MRNVSRFLAILGVAVVLVAVSTPASAVCSPPKTASTFTSDLANYVYFDLGPGTTAAQTVGSYYDLNGADNGAYPSSSWLFVDVSGKLSMSANLGAAGTNGCPSGKLIVRVQASTPTGTRLVTATAQEGIANPAGATFDLSFNHPPNTVFPSTTIPRPRVNSSSRSGSVVNLNIALDSASDGNSGGDAASAITSYDIVKASGADPGRAAAGWTLVQNVPAPNGGAVPSVPLTADCSTPSQDQFFATRAVFGTSKSELVSNSTRVNCNPALAEPRFNVVPKKPVGPKKGVNQ
jgi:hypothetical protein